MRLTGILLAALAAGCAYTPLRGAYPGPQPLPPSIAAYYEYPHVRVDAAVELVDDRRQWTESLVRFPLSVSDFEPTEPTVELEWFESKRPGRRPAIVFNPILGGDYPLERGICRFLARNGFHVAMVRRKTLKISPEHQLDRIELLLRQGILRIRQVVDWMETHDRVDPDRMGSFGVSMGGMASVIAAAVEPRLKAHVAALAGGSIADILVTSHDSLLTKPRHRYLERNEMDLETFERLLRKHVKTDPVALAPYVDSRRILLFVAMLDRTVGTDNSLRLRRTLSHPKTQFIAAGHYTAYLYLPFIEYSSLRFLKRELRVE